MLLIYKNKGILVVVYCIVSLLTCAMLAGVLHRNIGGVFAQINVKLILAIGFLIAGFWTYITRNSYYKDANGNKKLMDWSNEFFFMSMKVWAYIFWAASVMLLIISFL